MLREQRLDDFRWISEIRRLESSNGCREVNKPTPCCKIENAERAGYCQAVQISDRDAGAVIHHYQIGSD
jgi:hypothetical protein